MQIGDIKYLVAAEVDCASADPPAKNYMELKTSRIMSQDNHIHTFEKHKMLKFVFGTHFASYLVLPLVPRAV